MIGLVLRSHRRLNISVFDVTLKLCSSFHLRSLSSPDMACISASIARHIDFSMCAYGVFAHPNFSDMPIFLG